MGVACVDIFRFDLKIKKAWMLPSLFLIKYPPRAELSGVLRFKLYYLTK